MVPKDNGVIKVRYSSRLHWSGGLDLESAQYIGQLHLQIESFKQDELASQPEQEIVTSEVDPSNDEGIPID